MTGNRTIDNLIITLSILASLAGVGTFVYTEMIFKKPLPKDEVELGKLKKDHKNMAIPESYKVDKITVNLPVRNKRLRFLDVEPYIVVFKKRDIKKLEEKKPQINDIIINVASKMEPEDLNSISGKLIFESRIKNSINALYPKAIVKGLFFTKFVVQ